MTNGIIKYLALLFPFFLLSCDMFDYHQLDGRTSVGRYQYENLYNYYALQNYTAEVPLRFIFIGDTHRNDKETEAFVKHINQRYDYDFILHAGDITDFGHSKEYEWSYNILKKLFAPKIVVLGNHDILSFGDLVYYNIYGPPEFYFTVRGFMFVVINTNRLEYRNPEEIPSFNFIDDVLDNSITDYTGVVMVMHAPPGSEQFNDEKVVGRLADKLGELPNLYFCLHGHTHKHSVSQPLGNDITFIGCDNIAKRTYLFFEITKEGYTYEVVPF